MEIMPYKSYWEYPLTPIQLLYGSWECDHWLLLSTSSIPVSDPGTEQSSQANDPGLLTLKIAPKNTWSLTIPL